MAERSRRPGGAAIAAGAAVIVLVGGGVAWAATRSSGPAYRLATVSRADVEQTVTEVGTISSINERSVSFPVSGTVRAVAVSLGESVAAGQTLATLDTTQLAQEVESADGALASAKQRLADDQASESSSDTTQSASESPLSTSPAAPPTSTTGSEPSASGSSIGGLQAAVIRDQQAVDAGLATVSADVNAVHSACSTSTVAFTVSSDANGIVQGNVSGAAGLPVSIPADTDAAGAAIPATTVGADGSYTFGSSSEPLRANATYTVQLGDSSSGVAAAGTCQMSLQSAQNDEQAVAVTERNLAADEQKLDSALKSGVTKSGGGSGTSTTGGATRGGQPDQSSSAPAGTTGQSTASAGRGGSSGLARTAAGSTVITAEQLAADQKSIDAASAQRVVAEQNLAAATLTAPIAGTVANVSMTSGTSVSAASSSSSITIIGTGQKEVTTTVGIASVDLVKKGDSAAVTVDGVSRALAGRVTEVGILNTSGTSGATSTYPVTIVLDPTAVPLYDGAGATVAIDVGTARDVLTVPTSALTSLTSPGGSSPGGSTVGTRAVVSVYAAGKATRTVVETGVVGVDRTEITAGLKAGDQVILADLHAAVPTSSTSNRLARLTGGGGIGAGLGGATIGGNVLRRGGN